MSLGGDETVVLKSPSGAWKLQVVHANTLDAMEMSPVIRLAARIADGSEWICNEYLSGSHGAHRSDCRIHTVCGRGMRGCRLEGEDSTQASIITTCLFGAGPGLHFPVPACFESLFTRDKGRPNIPLGERAPGPAAVATAAATATTTPADSMAPPAKRLKVSEVVEEISSESSTSISDSEGDG